MHLYKAKNFMLNKKNKGSIKEIISLNILLFKKIVYHMET